MPTRPYRTYTPGSDQANPDNCGTSGLNWAREDESKRGAALVERVDGLLDDQSDYLTACEQNLRMYRNLQSSGTLPFRFLRVDSQGREVNTSVRRTGLNVVRPMCNTVASKIGKERPRSMYHTDGGGRVARRQAKELQLFSDGLHEEQHTHRHTARTLLDSLVFGTGYVKSSETLGSRTRKSVNIRRIFTPQVLVDRIDGADGYPREMFEIFFIDKHELAWRFPEFEGSILGMSPRWYQNHNIWWRNFGTDKHSTLMIRFGYRLPSEKGADDGVYAIGIEELTLETGKWIETTHPYSSLRWIQSPDGFYGMGLCEELASVQGEINRLMRRIQAAMILLSNPYVFADKDSGISLDHIQGIPGTIIKHNYRREPKVHAPSVVHQEVFAHLDRLYQRAFEIAGVSQLSATAKIPANLESGRAALVQADIQTDRFALFNRGFHGLHKDVDYKALRCAARINHQVRAVDPTTKAFRTLNWKELGVALDGFTVKASITSLLATEPSGKLDNLERLDAQGLVLDPEEKLALIDDPDLESFTHRHTAARNYFEKIFEEMLYNKGEYEPPDGVLPLDRGIEIAQEMYIEALAEGVDQEALDNVTRWVNTARIEVKNAKKAVQPDVSPILPTNGAAPAMGPPPSPVGVAPPLIQGGALPPGGSPMAV